jgi:hypothetical protein
VLSNGRDDEKRILAEQANAARKRAANAGAKTAALQKQQEQRVQE